MLTADLLLEAILTKMSDIEASSNVAQLHLRDTQKSLTWFYRVGSVAGNFSTPSKLNVRKNVRQ